MRLRSFGSLRRATSLSLPPSCAHCGMVAVRPVLLAIYGYWSAVTRTPRARAASTSAITSFLRPKFFWPVTFT